MKLTCPKCAQAFEAGAGLLGLAAALALGRRAVTLRVAGFRAARSIFLMPCTVPVYPAACAALTASASLPPWARALKPGEAPPAHVHQALGAGMCEPSRCTSRPPADAPRLWCRPWIWTPPMKCVGAAWLVRRWGLVSRQQSAFCGAGGLCLHWLYCWTPIDICIYRANIPAKQTSSVVGVALAVALMCAEGLEHEHGLLDRHWRLVHVCEVRGVAACTFTITSPAFSGAIRRDPKLV